MRNLPVLFILMLKCLDSFGYQEDLLKKYPHVVLSNGIIETSVFLPDPEKGFYRSTRFEWSGMMFPIIANKKTGASVEISGNVTLSEFHFWADDITICPEFFIKISVEPGETMAWKRMYRFFEE